MKLARYVLILLFCLPAFATVRNVKTTCGAVGNGVANDTAAVNSCIALLVSGDTLEFPAGTYLVTALNAINVSNVTIDGSSNTAIVTSKTTQQGPLFIVGTAGFAIGGLACTGRPGIASGFALSATANETATSFSTASALSGVGVGSYVQLLQGGRDSSTGSGNTGCDVSGCRGEFAKVTGVSGSTYTVDTMLHDTYSPSVNGAIACPVNGLISGVTLQNITIDGGINVAQTTGNSWVAQFNTCANCTISGVTFRNALGAALLLEFDYNLTISNVTITGAGSEGCQAAMESFGISNVTMNTVSLSSLNPSTGGTCIGDGAFGIEESGMVNSAVTNLTVNSASAGGRPMKLTASRWNTYSNLVVENGANTAGFNGLSLEYYSGHNLFNGGSILNNAGASGSGSAGINSFGNFNQYNTFYNMTITGNGNVQFYNSGFDDLQLAQDWYESLYGNTLGGSGTIGILWYGSNGCILNNTLNAGMTGGGISVRSPSTGTVGTGNTLNGNSSNLTAGACSTTGANGSGALASSSPSSLSFGNQATGTTSAAQIVTLTNGISTFNGTNGLSFVSQSLQTGTQFAFTSGCTGKTVGPGSTCSLSVTFTPTALGAQSDTLEIIDSASGAMQTIALSGTGTGGASAPTVTTTTATSITNTSASAGGTVTSNGGASVTAEGTCFGLSANPTTPCTNDGTATPFTSLLTPLTPGTLYHYRAFARNTAGTGYGADQTFTTTAVIVCGPPNYPCSNQTQTTVQTPIYPPISTTPTQSYQGAFSINSVGYDTSLNPTQLNRYMMVTDATTSSNRSVTATYNGDDQESVVNCRGRADWDAISKNTGTHACANAPVYFLAPQDAGTTFFIVFDPSQPVGSQISPGTGQPFKKTNGNSAGWSHADPSIYYRRSGTQMLKDVLNSTATALVSETTLFDAANCPGFGNPIYNSTIAVNSSGVLTIGDGTDILTFFVTTSGTTGGSGSQWIIHYVPSANTCATLNTATGKYWSACVLPGSCTSAAPAGTVSIGVYAHQVVSSKDSRYSPISWDPPCPSTCPTGQFTWDWVGQVLAPPCTTACSGHTGMLVSHFIPGNNPSPNIRTFANPSSYTTILTFPTPLYDLHMSPNNVDDNDTYPVIVGSGGPTGTWTGAYFNEIFAMQYQGANIGKTSRFGHCFIEGGSAQENFQAANCIGVSFPDGKYWMGNMDMLGQLGTDAIGNIESQVVILGPLDLQGSSPPTAATPTISPTTGTYTAPLTVTGTTTSAGAIQCWNLTGSPATNHAAGCAPGSTLFTGGVTLNASGTIYFVAGGAGYQDSGIASTAYTINQQATTPTFSPNGGTFAASQSVTISTTVGSQIWYNTTGSPTCGGGTQYTTPVTVSSTETLYAVACGSGYTVSPVGSAAFTIVAPSSFSAVVSGSAAISGSGVIQ
jgi:hypothetical protein